MFKQDKTHKVKNPTYKVNAATVCCRSIFIFVRLHDKTHARQSFVSWARRRGIGFRSCLKKIK
jgi:hypothetical protein